MLYEKLSFDFIRDIAPVASIGDAPTVMVTNLSFPAKTVPEFAPFGKPRLHLGSQLGRVSASNFIGASGPPVLDLGVLPDGPAQLLQPLEGGIAITARRLSFHAHQTSAC